MTSLSTMWSRWRKLCRRALDTIDPPAGTAQRPPVRFEDLGERRFPMWSGYLANDFPFV